MNKYLVTVEDYNGECKVIMIFADDPSEAMAIVQLDGWYPVDVQPA